MPPYLSRKPLPNLQPLSDKALKSMLTRGSCYKSNRRALTEAGAPGATRLQLCSLEKDYRDIHRQNPQSVEQQL